MKNNWSAKIYWVQDSFSHYGNNVSGEIIRGVAKVDKLIIEDYLIKFWTVPINYEKELWSYYVELNVTDKPNKFKGMFKRNEDLEHLGEVSCEIFRNENNIFLFGQWIEADIVFTFWIRTFEEIIY